MKRISIIGCAAAVIAVVFATVPAAAHWYREKVLHGFGNFGDGVYPQGNVVMDALGNLYGTAENGGGTGCRGGGCGIVFKLSPDRSETILHAFNGRDGAFPIAGLVMDTAGNLYGTTLKGGPRCGCGTVFKLAPDGTETMVHAFRGGWDGAFPLGALIFDQAGNLYGTTSGGGRDCNGSGIGCGTVFRIDPAGQKTTLHAFRGDRDGIYPAAELSLGADGNFYGTTANGGIDCDSTGQGCGIVFKLTPEGQETVLYRFEGGPHGAYPAGGVTADAAGNLYGTTNNGGVDCDGSGGCGVVFKVAADGTETALHVFAGGDDGMHPRATPLIDSEGNLFGTASSGGATQNEAGVVFRLRPGGAEKILYAFTGFKDGGGPFSGLTQDASGNLYGTTYFGGRYYSGTVFELKYR